MKYSIVLPVRNGGEYVKECVNSILVQTLNDFNLHVLDNASTDGTSEWLASLNDPRITIHRSAESLSIEKNWSRIVSVPKNEFMTMIGHDDILEPFYLEEMDKLIAEHPEASLYQTHYNYIDKDGNVTRACLPMDKIQTASEFLACQMNNTIESTGTGYIMRSKDYDEAGGIPVRYPNLIFSDYELWIKLGSKSYKATSAKQCFRYRVHMSVSRVTNGMLYLEAFETYVRFMAGLSGDTKFAEVINRYGRKMLLYFCESLAHRLLKTPVEKRAIKVKDLISRFEDMAKLLVPGQPFNPLLVRRIKLAASLDSNPLSRNLFNAFNTFILQKNVRY